MSGVAIEYLLGLYFIIASVEIAEGRFNASVFKLCAGIILTIAAILHFSLLK